MSTTTRPAGGRLARFVAVMCALALVPATVVVADPSPAMAAGCSRTESRALKLDTFGNDYIQYTKLKRSGGTPVTERFFIKDHKNLGRVKVTFDMCKDLKTGKWRVDDGVSPSTPHNDLKMTTVGTRSDVSPLDNDDRGYGVFFRAYAHKKVVLWAVRCTTKPQKLGTIAVQTVKGLLGLPWAYTKNVYAVGAYAASQLLPDAPADQYHCGRIGADIELPIKFRASDGKPMVKWGTVKHALRAAKSPESENACGGDTYIYCSESRQQSILVEKT